MESECIICEGQFKPIAIDDDGKCKYCAEEYPKAKNRDEAIRQTISVKEQQITLTEERVRTIIQEELVKVMESTTAQQTAQADKKKLAEARERAAKARAAKKTKEVKLETEVK